MLKKLLSCLLSFVIIVFLLNNTVYASENRQKIIIGNEVFYLITTTETISQDDPQNITDLHTTTGTNTIVIVDTSDNPLWSLSITATFIYDGTMSQCVACSHQTTSYNALWTTKSSSCGHSGNHATASATVTWTSPTGPYDYNYSVTISCTPAGVIY